jgi:hypothetical protein
MNAQNILVVKLEGKQALRIPGRTRNKNMTETQRRGLDRINRTSDLIQWRIPVY